MDATFERLVAALKDRYRIERELGAGGMAIVYLAHDLRHDRKVAVKVLRSELAASLGADRFLREVRIAANLSHPHVLPLYDSGEADGFLYYVMPFVEGISLRSKLQKTGELAIADALRILVEVVDALAYAHQHGVVHRDIKPDNVMLSGRHALVTDFGVAKAVSEATGRQELTTIGVALGTPSYMSPEQAAADPHVDHRADIYAVGVMAYELLTGRTPFAGLSPQQVLAAHVTTAPEPVTQHRSAVPTALADIVMRCLEKKPADRWQTADELLSKLEPLVGSSGETTPTHTRPLSAVSPPVSNGAPATPLATGRPRRALVAAGATAAVVALALILWSFLVNEKSSGSLVAMADAAERKAVAVLPFTSANKDEESEFFTSGIHDDILTQLSKIAALKVISRTSVQEYKNTQKNARQIGEELRVAALLEGSVQRAGRRVRINVTLIDAKTDEQLWADVYDRELTMDTRFTIQAEIAQEVATALKAALSPREREQLARMPTTNAEAYAAYQRARDLHDRDNARSSMLNSITLLERAVSKDSNFAEAWALLGINHSSMYWFHYDHTPKRLAQARSAIENAFRARPDMPEAHVARGFYHYWGELDYDRAITEFEQAAPHIPSSLDIAIGIGSVRRRQGRMDEALTSYRRGHELNPRASDIASTLAETLTLMRRFAEAKAVVDSLLLLDVDNTEGHTMAYAVPLGQGDIRAARAALDTAYSRGVSPDDLLEWPLVILEGDYARAVKLISAGKDPAIDDQFQFRPKSLALAEAYSLMRDEARARAHFDFARVVLERAAREHADDPRIPSALALAYAGLGRKADAIREARRGSEMLPIDREVMRGAARLETLAQVLTMVGEPDSAIAKIELLLSRPGTVSPGTLRISPEWTALRRHPRFQRLLKP